MNIKLLIRTTLVGVITTLMATTSAQARDAAPGYTADPRGNIIRGGFGDCIHTGSWKPEMANIVGCDGVTVDVEVETVRGDASGITAKVVMPSTAMFAFDSAELTEEGKQTIEENRSILMPELARAYVGIIIGHTDSTGDAEYNKGLSLRRAKSVRDYLIATGADPAKLQVVGRGEEEPTASNDTAEGRAANRRVEGVVIGELRALDAMRFPSVALFERRSAELTAQGKQVINKHRENAREQFRRASYIEIIGHTDDVGDDEYNQELSEQRAQSVYNYLAETGLDVSKVVVKGLGESSPVASNRTEEGRAENRRVEVLLLGRKR